MITFLPDPIYHESAKILDNKRLGKQRVECVQLLKMLLGHSTYNHKFTPAINMWQGYEYWLIEYSKRIVEEWVKRGFVDNCMKMLDQLQYDHYGTTKFKLCDPPYWCSDKSIYASHRSNLLRKDPDFYSKYEWCEPYNLKYVWPKPYITSMPFMNVPWITSTPTTLSSGFNEGNGYVWVQSSSWPVMSNVNIPQSENWFVDTVTNTKAPSPLIEEPYDSESTPDSKYNDLAKKYLKDGLYYNPDWDKSYKK